MIAQFTCTCRMNAIVSLWMMASLVVSLFEDVLLKPASGDAAVSHVTLGPRALGRPFGETAVPMGLQSAALIIGSGLLVLIRNGRTHADFRPGAHAVLAESATTDVAE